MGIADHTGARRAGAPRVVIDGADALRVVLIGSGVVTSPGVDRHVDGFAGAVGRALAAATGRGVDVRVVADTGMSMVDVADLASHTRLEDADLVLVSGDPEANRRIRRGVACRVP